MLIVECIRALGAEMRATCRIAELIITAGQFGASVAVVERTVRLCPDFVAAAGSERYAAAWPTRPLSGEQLHHTGHRIRAIKHAGGSFENFDALDVFDRQVTPVVRLAR